MTSNLVTDFVNDLIKKTLSEDIEWQSLNNVVAINGTPIDLYFSLDEFHTVNFFESYYCATKGMIFLISERTESGRDGKVSEGYNLYIRLDPMKPLSSVVFDTSELYRLKNAIELKSDLTKDVVDFMKSFMEGKG